MEETEGYRLAALPLLVEALHDDDKLIPMSAIDALARAGSGAVPALEKVLKDGDPMVRSATAQGHAARILGAMGADAAEAVPRLIAMMGGEGRWDAILALGAIGAPVRDAVPHLVEALGDPGETAWHAAEALSISAQIFAGTSRGAWIRSRFAPAAVS